MKITVILLLSVALSGCASSFEPSETFLSMRGKITRPQAVTILNRVSSSTGANGGAVVCQLGTAYGVDKDTRLEFTETGFSYQAYTKGKFVGEKDGIQYFEKGYFQKVIPFDDIHVVRILSYQGTDCRSVKYGKYDYVIVLQNNPFTTALSIAVKENDLDRYLAAITSLTDNPRMVQGAGL